MVSVCPLSDYLRPFEPPGCGSAEVVAQVETLVLATAPGYAPTDWTDDASWARALDNRRGHLIELAVIGSVAEVARTLIRGPRGIEWHWTTTYELTARPTQTDDELLALVRFLNCDPKGLRAWYATPSHLFGGPTGIELRTVSALDFAGDANDHLLRLQWVASCDPLRTSPYTRLPAPADPGGWIDDNGNPWSTDDDNPWIW